ncbi:MAG: Molybdopterin or thiamine biosynthesis adenylyltransferase [Verrucomicrobia bacterium]|jgi:molybdopterin/thiamine biosynthesis adenylyltransferase|nr:MAG: Molybdopterin or thiamine biosynthesis adenylyltransferase [Verrucomicrobiota bacterium]
MNPEDHLSGEDRAIYAWQMDLPGFGESAQAMLRRSTALVSRCGGVGGHIAFSLAAAGIGKLVLAHAGDLRPDDLNRQILMRHEGIGRPRTESIVATLRAFNPGIEVEAVPENVGAENVSRLVDAADMVFSAAPLFEERFHLNRACVELGKPFVDCAMYGMEGQVIPVLPGKTACLACLYPEMPPHWRRRFPVLGAVAALAGNVGAIEGIKLLTGLGTSMAGRMIFFDAAEMRWRTIGLERKTLCRVCGSGAEAES